MVFMAKPRGRGKAATPSEFGWELDNAMRYGRITTGKALAEKLEEDGYPISPQMVSGYRSGKSKVPVKFVVQLIESLDLPEDIQDALARAWAAVLPEGERNIVTRSWGSNPTKQNLEMADKIETDETLGKADHQSKGDKT